MPVKPKKKLQKKAPPKQRTIQEIIESEEIDLDPRKQAFALAYMDPLSITYGNAYRSALKSGFSDEYSKNITSLSPMWLSEIIGKFDMLGIVRRNIKKHLELKTSVPVIGMFGPIVDKKTKKPMMREDEKLLKLQQDMTIFVAEKLMHDYRKKGKEDLLEQKVEIGQVIILASNGEKVNYNQSNSEAASRLLEASNE